MSIILEKIGKSLFYKRIKRLRFIIKINFVIIFGLRLSFMSRINMNSTQPNPIIN